MGLKTWLGMKNRLRRYSRLEKKLTAQELSDQDRLLSALRSLTPKRAVGFEKARVGCDNDGGYVMLDDFNGIAVAVSCGVGLNWSWDSAIADRGIPVRQFDQIKVDDAAQGPLFDFKCLCVSAARGPGRITLDEIVDDLKPDPATAVLKIDIEGDEWDVFGAASDSSLSPFSQIVVELHNLGSAHCAKRLYKYEATLAKLSRQFQSVHVHGNNHAPCMTVFNIMLPDVLEVTFANRQRYVFTDTTETFPTLLDMPNKRNTPDLWLGTFSY
jgi:hypothetical protein